MTTLVTYACNGGNSIEVVLIEDQHVGISCWCAETARDDQAAEVFLIYKTEFTSTQKASSLCDHLPSI